MSYHLNHFTSERKLYQETNCLSNVGKFMPWCSCKLQGQNRWQKNSFSKHQMQDKSKTTSSVALVIQRSSSARPDLTYSPFENVQHSRRSRRLQKMIRIQLKEIKAFQNLNKISVRLPVKKLNIYKRKDLGNKLTDKKRRDLQKPKIF